MIHPPSPVSPWKINNLEMFVAPGLSVQLFHDFYPEGRQGGITLIQKDDRIAANGDVRLEAAPGQWASLPVFDQRKVDTTGNHIAVKAHFDKPNLDYSLRVTADGEDLLLSVDLEKPLPRSLENQASFNLELYPVRLFGKGFLMDGHFGTFPPQANGPVSPDDGKSAALNPIAAGNSFTVMPENPGLSLTITSGDSQIELLDGRESVANGWFICRSLLQGGKTRDALCWRISMQADKNYRKPPVIGFSQVGYHPGQPKRAILECDGQTEQFTDLKLEKIGRQGTERTFFIRTAPWGRFLRYSYGVADFSHITEPGLYRMTYENQTTPVFRIDPAIYDEGVWQPTMETYMPVQMCHMAVHDGYRLWHGCCHLDDGLQAPCDHVHFDGYHQYESSESDFSPGQFIPGMDRGGWHDAGDFDLATGSQSITTYTLALIRETFGIETDQTTVDFKSREVQLHKPDGIPDVIQQVRHGAEFLLQAYRHGDHSFAGVIAGSHAQYVHLGDAATMTDNDPQKAANAGPEDQKRRVENPARLDPRWVFTNRDSSLEYAVAATLTTASRVMRDFYPDLADQCASQARRIWDSEAEKEPVSRPAAYIPGNVFSQKTLAAVELFHSTGKIEYLNSLVMHREALIEKIELVAWRLLPVLEQIEDKEFCNTIENAVRKYASTVDRALADNPYNILWEPHVWGVGWQIQRFAMSHYFLHKARPEIFTREPVFDVVNYVLGCHPASNTSLVTGVGAHSLMVAYGTNRADWSNIPGGMVSGPNLIRPDFPEMKEPYPYIWQQTEYVMSGAASYMFCVLAAKDLLDNDPAR